MVQSTPSNGSGVSSSRVAPTTSGQQKQIKELESAFKILVFSWNSNKASISEYRTQPPYYFQGQFGDPAVRDSSFPLFLDAARKEIAISNPVIVFFATQNSRKPGDQLHSKSISQMFQQLETENKKKYSKLRSSRKIGAGGGTSKLPIPGGLRNSIWVLNQVKQEIEKEERSLVAQYGTSLSREYSCGMGLSLTRDGLASYLKYNGTVTAFINCYLDEDKPGLKAIYTSTTGFKKRKQHIQDKNKCLSNIIRELTKTLTKTGDKIDFVVVAGDLGYRSVLVNEWIGTIGMELQDSRSLLDQFNTGKILYNPYHKILEETDELTINIPFINGGSIREGILGTDTENKEVFLGPTFPPTCDLKKDRTRRTKNIRGRDTANPDPINYLIEGHWSTFSWCNRILYFSNGANEGLECRSYYSFDHLHMDGSPQTAVLAEFIAYPSRIRR